MSSRQNQERTKIFNLLKHEPNSNKKIDKINTKHNFKYTIKEESFYNSLNNKYKYENITSIDSIKMYMKEILTGGYKWMLKNSYKQIIEKNMKILPMNEYTRRLDNKHENYNIKKEYLGKYHIKSIEEVEQYLKSHFKRTPFISIDTQSETNTAKNSFYKIERRLNIETPATRADSANKQPGDFYFINYSNKNITSGDFFECFQTHNTYKDISYHLEMKIKPGTKIETFDRNPYKFYKISRLNFDRNKIPIEIKSIYNFNQKAKVTVYYTNDLKTYDNMNLTSIGSDKGRLKYKIQKNNEMVIVKEQGLNISDIVRLITYIFANRTLNNTQKDNFCNILLAIKRTQDQSQFLYTKYISGLYDNDRKHTLFFTLSKDITSCFFALYNGCNFIFQDNNRQNYVWISKEFYNREMQTLSKIYSKNKPSNTVVKCNGGYCKRITQAQINRLSKQGSLKIKIIDEEKQKQNKMNGDYTTSIEEQSNIKTVQNRENLNKNKYKKYIVLQSNSNSAKELKTKKRTKQDLEKWFENKFPNQTVPIIFEKTTDKKYKVKYPDYGTLSGMVASTQYDDKTIIPWFKIQNYSNNITENSNIGKWTSYNNEISLKKYLDKFPKLRKPDKKRKNRNNQSTILDRLTSFFTRKRQS